MMKTYNDPDIFENIYKKNKWKNGSGLGSLPNYNKSYIKVIEEFIKTHNIKSIVDFGCGDWQFSRFIDWQNAKYTGYDVAPYVIEKNIESYKNENIEFLYTPDNWNEIKEGDLLICKDVLQHLNNECIDEFIKIVLPKFKYAFIINCTLPIEKINKEIKNGKFRPVDLRFPPYNIYMERIYRFPVKRKVEVKYLLLYDKTQPQKDMSKDFKRERIERNIILFKFSVLEFFNNLIHPIKKEKQGSKRIIHVLNIIKISYKKDKKYI